MKTKVSLFIVMFLFFGVSVASSVSGVENSAEVNTRITGIVIYPNSIVYATREGVAWGGSEFHTFIEESIVPRSIRLISRDSCVNSISLVSSEGVSVERPLTILDMLNQSLNKRVEAVTYYGRISGRLYRLEGDLMFLSDVTWVTDDETLKHSFFTMRVSDIRNLVFSDRHGLDFKPVYRTVESETMSYGYYGGYYDTTPAAGSKRRLSWKCEGNGSGNVSIKYRTRGVSWEPVYYLDIGEQGIDEADFGFWAQVTNDVGFDLWDVDVDLVAGNIKLSPDAYMRGMEYISMSQVAVGSIMGAMGEVITAAVSTLEEHRTYSIGRVCLGSGETRLVEVFNKTVDFERDYVWDARSGESRVQSIYRLINGEDITWPYGVVGVYKNQVFIGEDTISWTPKGREAKVTVGYAPDIEVDKHVTSKRIPQTRDKRHKATLTLTNYKGNSVTITVMDSFPEYAEDFRADLDFEEKPGNLMYWNITLNPGEKREITYEYVD